MKKINIVWTVLGLVCLSLAIYSISSPSQTYNYNSSNNGGPSSALNSRRYIENGWVDTSYGCVIGQPTGPGPMIQPLGPRSATYNGFPFYESYTQEDYCVMDHANPNPTAKKYNRIFQITLFALTVGFFAVVIRNILGRKAMKS